ncbi:LGFP repeat-containing protein [Gordonia aurantiaca]|uniref:LGFP repeat-containing protein n=1 Tax=Gordonia sp. B21 TaxID=3151852 RepID=UPI0032636407
MSQNSATRRLVGIAAGVAIATLGVAGCSDDSSDETSSASSAVSEAVDSGMSKAESAISSAESEAADADDKKVELTAPDGTKVTLTGSIAAKYGSATDAQRADLGAPLTGENAAGTGDNGVVFQQFEGGVITAKDDDADTPAYITWGKIRDAWNVPRDAEGNPSPDGKGGSQGPLGVATSDETEKDGVKESTFEHGKITWDSATDKVEVTVNGKVVPTR